MNDKIIVVALGTAGIRILNAFAATYEKAPNCRLVAIDSDRRSLNAITAPSIEKIEAGFTWTSGGGCGGDALKGERCAAEVRDTVLELTQNAKSVIWLTGLGGGMAGGLPLLRRPLAQLPIAQIILGSTPFEFEGAQRHENAKLALAALENDGVLLPICNDLILASLGADIPARDAFATADKQLSVALFGFIELFNASPLLADGYTGIRTALENRAAVAGIGVSTLAGIAVGTAAGTATSDRMQQALLKLQNSALLGGMRAMKQADTALEIITASSDLSIGEMRKGLENLRSLFGEKTRLVTAVSLNPLMKESVQLTLITLSYRVTDKEQTPENATALERTAERLRQAARESPFATSANEQDLLDLQPDLPLINVSRGIFESAMTTPVDGQDLDIPSFLRNAVSIDRTL